MVLETVFMSFGGKERQFDFVKANQYEFLGYEVTYCYNLENGDHSVKVLDLRTGIYHRFPIVMHGGISSRMFDQDLRVEMGGIKISLEMIYTTHYHWDGFDWNRM